MLLAEHPPWFHESFIASPGEARCWSASPWRSPRRWRRERGHGMAGRRAAISAPPATPNGSTPSGSSARDPIPSPTSPTSPSASTPADSRSPTAPGIVPPDRSICPIAMW